VFIYYAVTSLIAITIAACSNIFTVWLALRGTKPAERPDILRALSHVMHPSQLERSKSKSEKPYTPRHGHERKKRNPG
jgi:hypothetical protein